MGITMKKVSNCCTEVEVAPLSRSRSVTREAGVKRWHGRTSDVCKRAGSIGRDEPGEAKGADGGGGGRTAGVVTAADPACLEAFKMFLRVKRFGTPGLGPRY